MGSYHSYLKDDYVRQYVRHLEVSSDDIRLAEMIVLDSLIIDYSRDMLYSFDALRLIQEGKIKYHYQNVYELLNLNLEWYHRCWFAFIYDAYKNYEIDTINPYLKTALKPQQGENMTASKILGAWLDIEYLLYYDKKLFDDDTLIRLIQLHLKLQENILTAKQKNTFTSEIEDIINSSDIKVKLNQLKKDTSLALIFKYFVELSEFKRMNEVKILAYE